MIAFFGPRIEMIVPNYCFTKKSIYIEDRYGKIYSVWINVVYPETEEILQLLKK